MTANIRSAAIVASIPTESADSITDRHLEDLGARLASGVTVPEELAVPIRATILAAVEETLRVQEKNLLTAARLGKIAGLRRARKYYRQYAPWKIAESIRRTYQALGEDTDAYEQARQDEHTARMQARLDAALGTLAYEAGVAVMESNAVTETADGETGPFSADAMAGFAGMEPFTVPSVKTAYDTPTLVVDADAPRPVKDTPQA